ncbi:MAG: hypothetical protein EA377_04215 [Phycisphaerales bacterium]|nr:MAG: hypothetical protein EA377_04215 [Phycisphaerales bacterium]
MQATVIIGGGLCVIATVFILDWPTPDAPRKRDADRAAQPDVAPDRSTRDLDTISPVDETAFLAKLWNPAPPPPPPDPPQRQRPTPQPTPPQLELIAITWNGENHVAAVFIPAANELRSLQLGDEVDGFKVTLIDDRSVAIARGSVEHRLALVEPGGPS